MSAASHINQKTRPSRRKGRNRGDIGQKWGRSWPEMGLRRAEWLATRDSNDRKWFQENATSRPRASIGGGQNIRNAPSLD